MTKQEIIDKVMQPIINKGFQVYFVGGCVRDKIMNIEPHDYDLVTDATPAGLHTIFKQFSNQNSEIFGVTMPIIDSEPIEVATMRQDITKGRHPKIEFTKDIHKDAMRRDFTCNALYEDIHGNIIDPTGFGISAIEHKELRFVGNAIDRISEDPLRLFRFCRFEAQKGFSGDKTFQENKDKIIELIKSAGGANKFFKSVSKERMLKELVGIFGGKYFMSKTPEKKDESFQHMLDFGIFDILGIKKILNDLEKTAQNQAWHFEGNVLVHTLMVMKEMAKILNTSTADEHERFLMQMAALLHDIGKPVCAAKGEKKNKEDAFCYMNDHDIIGAPLAYDFCKSLGMTNKDSEIIKNLVENHMKIHKFVEYKSRYKVMQVLHNKDFNRLVQLGKADERGRIHNKVYEQLGLEEILKLPKYAEMLNTPMPKPLITGQDLLNAGCKPGPLFKKALQIAYKIQVDGHETRKEVILNNVKKLIK